MGRIVNSLLRNFLAPSARPLLYCRENFGWPSVDFLIDLQRQSVGVQRAETPKKDIFALGSGFRHAS